MMKDVLTFTRDDFIAHGIWIVKTPVDCPDGGSIVDYYATSAINNYVQGEWLTNFAEAVRWARRAYHSLVADRAQLGVEGLDPGLGVPDFWIIETCQLCENRRQKAWHEAHWDRDPWERCNRFVRAVSAFPCDTTLTPEQDDYILTLLRSCHLTKFDFVRVDEHPSQFEVFGKSDRSAWHWKVRQVRNNPNNNLYDILNANEDAGYTDTDIVPPVPHDYQGRMEL